MLVVFSLQLSLIKFINNIILRLGWDFYLWLVLIWSWSLVTWALIEGFKHREFLLSIRACWFLTWRSWSLMRVCSEGWRLSRWFSKLINIKYLPARIRLTNIEDLLFFLYRRNFLLLWVIISKSNSLTLRFLFRLFNISLLESLLHWKTNFLFCVFNLIGLVITRVLVLRKAHLIICVVLLQYWTWLVSIWSHFLLLIILQSIQNICILVETSFQILTQNWSLDLSYTPSCLFNIFQLFFISILEFFIIIIWVHSLLNVDPCLVKV